jgi:putative ABC transport system substrate-binding protein
MWQRRGLLIALIVAVVTSGPAALAQTENRPAGGKVYRLGVLHVYDPFRLSGIPAPNSLRSVTFAELARRGFVEGRDFVVELRFGSSEQLLADLARELVALKPDVILAMGGPAVRALRAIANPLPVVMGTGGSAGAATARPGDNYTGVVFPPAEQVDAKRLQLLHEALPAARRIGYLIRPIPVDEKYLPAARAIAEKLGMELLVQYATGPADYPAAFAAMGAAGAQAVYIPDTAEYNRDGAMLAKLALDTGLSAICGLPDMARDGCLMGHGLDIIETRRRTADYLARIFQGTPPGKLPIEEQPMSFAINLKTARVLGVDVPPVLLARADEVID